MRLPPLQAPNRAPIPYQPRTSISASYRDKDVDVLAPQLVLLAVPKQVVRPLVGNLEVDREA